MQGCTNASWNAVFQPNQSTATNLGFIYLQSTNGSATTAPSTNVEGMIRCDSEFSTGWATLSGADGTYTNFTETSLLNFTATQQGEPLLDPIYALMWYFDAGQRTSRLKDLTFAASAVQALGFTAIQLGVEPAYSQPTIDELAIRFWRGVSYMTTSIGLLSRSTDTTYPAIQAGVTVVYVREWRFLIATYALIGAWFLLLLLVTIRSFRPTFGSSFDRYLIAKLVLDSPDRTLDEDDLKKKFGHVAMNERGEMVLVE
ncbi:hypothetical protein C8F01DRAFT_5899 [Mycena amicta]|nr:hypothetical protein C8F01DRAFT_5899 [Mycena amicta]